VAEKTRDRIEELLGPGTINALTRAVLVNAIYFKGSWATAFDPEATRTRPFHLLDGSRRDVEMMHGLWETTYAKGDGWQAVRLPYFGASMLVVVPDSGNFASVESGLTADFLADVDRRMKLHDVDLGLPRWESASSIGLRDILRRMGMTDAFDPNLSDLTGVAPIDDLYVSDVIHQANVTVDEEGTEAAAATAVIMRVTSAAPVLPRVTLTVDRPFLYLIQDDATGEILFMGRLLTP
jgi:serpin B